MSEYNYKRANIEKAEAAMKVAAEYFRSLGFTVSDLKPATSHGVDLSITKGLATYKVEIKAVGFSAGAWRSRGRHLREEDDYVAFVFPSGRVHIEAIETHVKLRCKDGGRHLSKIAKLYV